MAIARNSFAENKTMQTNKDIVTRFNLEFIQGGDNSVFDEIVHPEFINHTVPAGAKGGDKQGTFDFIQIMRQAFPDLRVEILMMVAEGDLVTTHKAFHATHLGNWMGIGATGRTISFRVMDIIRVKDGKATEHWSVRDNMALYQQITGA
jgi:predicted ester cyclase